MPFMPFFLHGLPLLSPNLLSHLLREWGGVLQPHLTTQSPWVTQLIGAIDLSLSS